MRRVFITAGLTALIGLAACDSKTEEAAAPPPPPKSLARPQQMYAGQEQISKIDSATIKVSSPGRLDMDATGSVGMAGYKNAAFLPRINAAAPKDGVYEVDVVADRPATPGAAVVTPIEVKKAWPSYPADHLKGVKFIAKTNSVVAMLPAS
ncbi:hypothetical protein [Phenylobacterium sp.]|jgi:hypothetical protein|uniref:hypothetical protein n=1 Tax=Phenylobacterium sp. TaxID=1871053 RepID=UPI002E3369F9|nr:hypothetical protein [Phenylobacterium sp.]HEX4710743.1 hypothetical protein [Phenylobacterium sp.]